MAKMSDSNNQVEMFACANCGLEVRTKHSEFVEGTNCPKCKKPLFLVGQKNNMNLKINVEVSEALKGLKAVQREARKATAALKEFEEKQNTMNKKLLVIELENEESVPKVFYKGKEIKNKVDICFNWKTETEVPGKMSLDINHYDGLELKVISF